MKERENHIYWSTPRKWPNLEQVKSRGWKFIRACHMGRSGPSTWSLCIIGKLDQKQRRQASNLAYDRLRQSLKLLYHNTHPIMLILYYGDSHSYCAATSFLPYYDILKTWYFCLNYCCFLYAHFFSIYLGVLFWIRKI